MCKEHLALKNNKYKEEIFHVIPNVLINGST